MSAMKGGYNSVVKQAQKLQSRLSKLQEEMADRTVEAQVGGGAHGAGLTKRVLGQAQAARLYGVCDDIEHGEDQPDKHVRAECRKQSIPGDLTGDGHVPNELLVNSLSTGDFDLFS